MFDRLGASLHLRDKATGFCATTTLEIEDGEVVRIETECDDLIASRTTTLQEDGIWRGIYVGQEVPGLEEAFERIEQEACDLLVKFFRNKGRPPRKCLQTNQEMLDEVFRLETEEGMTATEAKNTVAEFNEISRRTLEQRIKKVLDAQ